MYKEFYTANEVAELLGLHVKTVRNHVLAGRLKSTPFGKRYRIAHKDLMAFTGGGESDTQTSVPPMAGARVDVTTVVQIDGVPRATVDRMTTMLTSTTRGRDDNGNHLRVETRYQPDVDRLKVVISGGAASTAGLLSMIATLAAQ
ncbi:MAG: helix-turn-helix domain-containing protein [Gammaproteobacteria bacterium]|nr:helix-turn-helix domain-containing protein [Gammaproteobacteria bacterium]